MEWRGSDSVSLAVWKAACVTSSDQKPGKWSMGRFLAGLGCSLLSKCLLKLMVIADRFPKVIWTFLAADHCETG